MNFRKYPFSILLCILLFTYSGIKLKSQSSDTKKAIEKIREKYKLINDQKIENFNSDVIDLSIQYETDPDEPGGPSGNTNTIEFYFNNIDTFFIKHIQINDEGGAYDKRITEVYLWNNKPFFYYSYSERMWEGIMEENRIYIDKDKVIQKLYKKAIFYSSESGYTNVSINDIPNEKVKFSDSDYNHVLSFLYEMKFFIPEKTEQEE